MVSSTKLLAKGQNNKETKLNRITKLTLLGKRTPFPSDCSEMGHQSFPVLRLKRKHGLFLNVEITSLWTGSISADPGSPVFWQQIIGKFSASITSWQTDGEKVETVTDFMFWGSKSTAGVDCSHEIKRHPLLGRKVMTNIDSILKSRDITLPTKVRRVKVLVFPVVMCRCEAWTVKKSEC